MLHGTEDDDSELAVDDVDNDRAGLAPAPRCPPCSGTAGGGPTPAPPVPPAFHGGGPPDPTREDGREERGDKAARAAAAALPAQSGWPGFSPGDGDCSSLIGGGAFDGFGDDVAEEVPAVPAEASPAFVAALLPRPRPFFPVRFDDVFFSVCDVAWSSKPATTREEGGGGGGGGG